MGAEIEDLYDGRPQENDVFEVTSEQDRLSSAVVKREDELQDAVAIRKRREEIWELQHKEEWKEWLRVSLFIAPCIDAGTSESFGFDDFLREIGKKPTNRHRVRRRDRSLRYQRGNLRWARRRIKKPTQLVSSPYLTVEEAAAYCRRCPKTVLNHLSLGNVKSMGRTRPPLFRREDLDDWLSAGRKKLRRN